MDRETILKERFVRGEIEFHEFSGAMDELLGLAENPFRVKPMEVFDLWDDLATTRDLIYSASGPMIIKSDSRLHATMML